jgi:Tol biopolymer transport system component
MCADGTQDVVLQLEEPYWAEDLTWSPDGSRFAFSYQEDFSLYGHVMVINVDGSDLHSVAEGDWQNLNPAWSPDSDQIAFEFWDEPDASVWCEGIFVVNADGTDLNVLIPGEYSSEENPFPGWPAWSPDGNAIAFTMDSYFINFEPSADIYLWDAASGMTQVTDCIATGEACIDPAWSPDGSELAFVKYRRADIGIISWLYVTDAAGSYARGITSQYGGRISSPAWSP